MKYFTTLIVLVVFGLGCGTSEKKTDTTPTTFDHTYASYATVLASHVHGELVDYAALKADRAALDSFIDQLAGISLEEFDDMDREEQKALWINAYNAITLRSVIDAYPVASINDIEDVWKGKRWAVAGEKVTLDNIENDILRPEFEDPRIHFAVNRASVGCPALQAQPYLPGRLDKQLYKAASGFVNNVDRNIINPHNNTITTAELFKLYGDDFADEYETDGYFNLEPTEAAVLNFIFSHADSSIFDFIDLEADWTLEYKPYDWSLNDVKEHQLTP